VSETAYRVEWDESRKGERGLREARACHRCFDVEADARRFARGLRSDVWVEISGVCIYEGDRRIAASFDDAMPL
jgi:hypothetical protein